MLEQMGAAAKAASYKLALLSSREKNRVLEKIADYLNPSLRKFCSPTSRICWKPVVTA